MTAEEHVEEVQVRSAGRVDMGRRAEDHDRMEARLEKFDDFMVETRERLRSIEATMVYSATKADVEQASSAMIKWIVATGLVVAGISLTIVNMMISNAAPKTPAVPAVQQPTPIVIMAPNQNASPTIPTTPAAPTGK